MVINKSKIMLKVIVVFVMTGLVFAACEKPNVETTVGDSLLVKFDADSNKVYYIDGCNEMNIDTMITGTEVYFTFSGCGKSFTYKGSLFHYNCYPVYDYWGYYLYDDCYWEYYPDVDIEVDSLVAIDVFEGLRSSNSNE